MPQAPLIQNEQVELVILGEAWDAALRQLLFEPGYFAVGTFRWQHLATGKRLLVDRLEVVDEIPNGRQRPPLDDWVVLLVDHADLDRVWSAEHFVGELKPKKSHVLAGVVIHNEGRRTWDGAVYVQGDLQPLSAVRVVGPGMLQLERRGDRASAADPSGELEQRALRFSRTIGALGEDLFRKVRRAQVTLIGAGRNGSQLALQLAALGVAQLRLVDGDRLGLENLDAMPGLIAADVGRPKVEALAERLLAFRPDLAVTCFARSATDAPVAEQLRRLPADLIATGVDSDTPRLLASLLARETLTPHLDVGSSVTRSAQGEAVLAGDARMLLPGQGCVACVGGLADREATLYELAAPAGALSRGVPQAWHEQRAGSVVTLNGLVVSAGVQLWLDLLSGSLRSSFWQRLRWLPGEGVQADGGPVGAAERCEFCESRP